jgi:hypothetical protein
MATVTINGTNYTFPSEGDLDWGSDVSDWAAAVSQHLLQKTGGSFTLSADVDFGSSKGLIAPYYKSKAANLSTAGTLRLGNTESIGWRNAANSANLLLSVNSSNELTFNGTALATSAGLVPVASGGTAIASYTAGDLLYASASTTFTKLAIGAANRVLTSTGTAPAWSLLVNANIDAAAAIAYSKLNLSGSIVNADISNSAAIAVNKLAALTASRLVVTDASGFASASSVTSTEAGYLSGVTSAVQPQLDGKEADNLIINGNFDFWQRGTTFTGIASSTYFADRFQYQKAGAAVHTASRSTDVPTQSQSSFQSSYSALLTLTTPDDSIAGSDYSLIRYVIEGHDYAKVVGRQVTLSFWVKATTTGTYCVSFANNGSDRSYIAEYTINSTDTWEKKSVTLTLNQSGGTENYTTGEGLRIRFVISAGTDFHGTAGSWASSDKYATSNQVNGTATGSTSFRIAQVQLQTGPIATVFNRAGKFIQRELELCQRYFEKSYALETAPGTATTTSAVQERCSSTNHYVSIWYKVPKVTSPGTITYYNPNSGGTGTWRDSGAANKTVTTSINGTGYLSVSVTSSVDTNAIVGHWTADSDFT